MKVIYGINKIKKLNKPVVALGVFDGVHRGHAYILKNTVGIARRIRGTAVALTFDPHPQKEGSLTSLEHRLRLIEGLGIKVCIVINFNRNFARIPARDFIKKILVKKLGPAYICVGEDFRFGKGASGDVSLLKESVGKYNFQLRIFKAVRAGGRKISSSYIRRLIIRGELQAAQKLLARPVSVLGTVVKGSSLATKLGFPTANINPHHEILPASGIYAVKVILGGRIFKGACSIGTSPTFSSSGKNKIEVYIFNFQRDIYGKYLEVQFIKKIRQQQKFASVQLLTQQVKKDILKVQRLFPHL
ncbi:MAG: riboflavin biosynthesis protein RibF [Candidatus Omnitrophica bacterium]|nr:riboflavin biosynthesis protein RibF [Candidatus Omnitrophota bacterium]